MKRHKARNSFGHLLLALLVVALCVPYISALDISDVTVYYSIDDADRTGNSINDLDGNIDATASDVTLGAVGKIDEAGNFNDANNYIKTDSPISTGTNGFSLSYWFKADTWNNAPMHVHWDDKTSNRIMYIQQLSSNNGLKFRTRTGANADYTIENINTDQWYFVTVTMSHTGTLKVYLDGSLEGSDTGDSVSSKSEEIYIGHLDGTTANYNFDGIIDEFAVYNKELSSTEVQDLYNSGNGLQYPFGSTPAGTNFTINATDSYNSSPINISVNMSYNGTTYSFNGYHIDTGLTDAAHTANITITADDYESRSFQNYNISSALETTLNLTYGRIVFDSNIKNIGNGSVVSNYTINATDTDNNTVWSYSTTGEDVIVLVPKNKTYNITIDAENYAIYSFTQAYATEVNITLGTIQIYETNSMYIRFYDEENGNLIDYETVSLDLISDVFANNYSSGTGELNITLLLPTTYNIRYSAPSYEERFMSLTVVDRRYNSLNLFLLNSSNYNNITITVIDQNTNALSGAVVKLLRYNLSTNSYNVVELGTTDVNGRTIVSAQKDTEFYKFVVQYGGETVLTTTPQYLTEDSYTIQVSIGDDITQLFDDYLSLDYVLTFNNATNNFRLTYNDITGFTTRVCLKVYRVSAQSQTLYNSSCSYSGASTLLVGVAAINGTTYSGKAYYYDTDGENFLDSYGYTFPESVNFGNSGLFIQLFFTIAVACIAIWSLPLTFILTPATLLLGRVMLFNTIGWQYLVPLQVIGIIAAIMLWRRS